MEMVPRERGRKFYVALMKVWLREAKRKGTRAKRGRKNQYIWFEGKSRAQRAKNQYNYWFYGESRAKNAEKYYSQYTWRPRPTEVISVSSILGIDFSIPQVWVWGILNSRNLSRWNHMIVFSWRNSPPQAKKKWVFGVYWKKISVTTGLPGNAVTLTGVSVSHALSKISNMTLFKKNPRFLIELGYWQKKQ